MKPELQKQLDTLLHEYDQKCQADKVKKEAIKTEEEKFLEAFYAARNATIHPALKEIGEAIKARGHGYEIITQDWKVDSSDKVTTNAEIKITFFPGNSREKPHYQPLPYPTLCFTCNRHNKLVNVHAVTVATGMTSSGSVGEYPLEQITADLVHAKAFDVLKQSLK